MNKIIIIGNVGQDPETKVFESGAKVTKITVAVSKKYKNKAGEQVNETEWFTVKAFEKLADIIEKYVKKGNKICVEGSIKTEKYKNKEGVDISSTVVMASNIEMLSAPQSQQPTHETYAQSVATEAAQPFDDLPF